MSNPRHHRSWSTRAAALIAALAGSSTALGIVSSNGANIFSGSYINNLVGATTFYNNGYTGSRATVTNVEAGHAWSGHETLGHLTTFFHDTGAGAGPQTGDTDRHATWVTQAIAGRKLPSDAPGSLGERVRQGIAYGSTIWSGSVAFDWPVPPPPTPPSAFRLGFSFSIDSLRNPYIASAVTGSGGSTTDVINSSWGNSNFPAGQTYFGTLSDAIANSTGKTFVYSAGNSGPPTNTVGSPASNFNNISVGSLGPDPSYNLPSGFSSRGPNDFFLPSSPNFSGFTPPAGSIIDSVRAPVDIAAPGQELTLAFYGGTTGGNVGGSPSGTPASYSGFLQGTSFAAPIVAGGAALVVDVMKDIHSTDPQAIDGRVIKAILQTSAQKDPGWNNGQAPVAGVITTTQSLDWETGAGILDLAQAYSHITSGTANVPGLGGGAVATNGWDFGQVAQGTPNDYIIGTPLLGGSTLTVTLDWFVDSVFSTTSTLVRYGSMDNLNLSVWEVIGGVPTNLIAESISIYNNVEHLSFQIPQDGDYAMRVTWNGEIYDFNGDVNQEAYGLSWSGVAVPAPGGVIVLLGAAAGALRRRRRI